MKANSGQDKDFAADLDSGIIGDLAVFGVAEVLSVLASVPFVGIVANTSLVAWQADQQRKFAKAVKYWLNTIDEKKVDKDYLKSDEFKELWLKILEEASKTGSERKQLALAGALVNSCALPGSKVPGKFSLLSVLMLMSDDALAVFQSIQRERTPIGVYEEAIADDLQLEMGTVQGVCEELEHNGLISLNSTTRTWVITARGSRLMQWYTGLERVEDREIFRTTVRQEVWEVLAERSRAEMRARGL